MNVEQQFVDLIKENKLSDAIALVKSRLTEIAGECIIEEKFRIAEGYGMKKKITEEDDDNTNDDDEKDMDDEEENNEEDDE